MAPRCVGDVSSGGRGYSMNISFDHILLLSERRGMMISGDGGSDTNKSYNTLCLFLLLPRHAGTSPAYQREQACDQWWGCAGIRGCHETGRAWAQQGGEPGRREGWREVGMLPGTCREEVKTQCVFSLMANNRGMCGPEKEFRTNVFSA